MTGVQTCALPICRPFDKNRDGFVLGFRGVNGKGEIIKSGGTVVKNVTGYDLSKLMSGSYGTLVALTEITFKVLPAYEENQTLIIHNHKIEAALDLLDKAVSSPNDVSGAVFLPKESKVHGYSMNIEKTFKLNDLKHEGSMKIGRASCRERV